VKLTQGETWQKSFATGDLERRESGLGEGIGAQNFMGF
jgi:hypothetical protein